MRIGSVEADYTFIGCNCAMLRLVLIDKY